MKKFKSPLDIHKDANPQSILEIFNSAFYLSWLALKNLFWILLLFVFFKNINLYIDTSISSSVLKNTIGVIQVMILIYLGVVILQVVNASIARKSIDYRLFFSPSLKKLLLVYFTFLLFGVFLVVMSKIIVFLLYLADSSGSDYTAYIRMFSFLFIGCCAIFVLLRYFFVIPLLVLGKTTLRAAFNHSGQLVLDNYIRTFSVYAVTIFIVYLCSQQTRHALFFQTYHLSYLFDYVVLCLLLPFSFNLILLLFKDLEIRYNEAQKYVNLR